MYAPSLKYILKDIIYEESVLILVLGVVIGVIAGAALSVLVITHTGNQAKVVTTNSGCDVNVRPFN